MQCVITMKRIFVIVFVLLFAQLHAQVRIDERMAFSFAERFLQENTRLQSPSLTLNEVINSKPAGQTNLYVFSIKPQGFVIVSALGDILAYSLVSNMPLSNALPDHISYWINLYNERTDHLISHPEQRKAPTRRQTSVEPLLTSCWGQGCFHNEACPMDENGPCHHVSAGCVAIAMAQIMYFHKQPTVGIGAATYHCPHYDTLSANFGQTVYHWEDMVDTLRESNEAVAQLVSHCGIAVNMQYGAHLSLASNERALVVLHQNFAYPHAKLLQRENLSDEEWTHLITNDLNLGHPVYYAGVSNLGGHAFVCDGYDSNGLFHFNYGWDGVADGYYTLSEPYGFSERQAIIYNIYSANNIPINSDEHNIIYVSQEGTGDGSSWENATRELQLAIFKSMVDSSSIWVKTGTYYGDLSYDYAFSIFEKCKLYGGFKGDEPFDYDLSLRDFEAHPSTLDGCHSQGVLNLLTSFDNDSILIDGFTIQNGDALQGGGIYTNGNNIIRNCIVCHNHANNGGGITQRTETPYNTVIEDCEFFNNSATKGGAIYDYGNGTYQQCQIHHNSASQKGGGILCNNKNNNESHGQSVFIGCTVNNNTADNGGGLYSGTTKATFWSCIFNNNTAQTGGGCELSKCAKLFNCTIVKNKAEIDYGGIYNHQSTGQECIMNCIVWGNVSQGENTQIWPPNSYSFCAVENDTSETGSNFKAESDNNGSLPRFYVRFNNSDVAAGNTGYGGDWRLRTNSLCINRGVAITNQPDTDLGGNPRFQHGGIDLGAYESSIATQLIDAHLCESAPYYFQDSLISELGTYTFLHNSNPFDTLVVIQMQLPPPVISYTKEICENEVYDFYGSTLNESGQYTATINCVTYQLNLLVEPMEHVYMQEEICDGDSFDFLGTPLHEEGVYFDTVDCIAYELNLNVKPSAYYHKDETICEGETYDFLGQILFHEGHYSETVDCQRYELDLTVNPKPILICNSDTLVEYGNLVSLSATGADSYIWSTGDTTECVTIYPFTDRTYTVTGFTQYGCSSSASVEVKVIKEADEMVLYPNPANNKTEIYKPLIDEIEVFNLLGVCIERIDAHRQLVVLDVSHYTSGVYIIHIRCLNNHYFHKLLIQH